LPLKLKVFGPYSLMQRVGEKLEDEFNSWAEKSGVDLENVKLVTANLPDRTMVLLVFYRS